MTTVLFRTKLARILFCSVQKFSHNTASIFAAKTLLQCAWKDLKLPCIKVQFCLCRNNAIKLYLRIRLLLVNGTITFSCWKTVLCQQCTWPHIILQANGCTRSATYTQWACPLWPRNICAMPGTKIREHYVFEYMQYASSTTLMDKKINTVRRNVTSFLNIMNI